MTRSRTLAFLAGTLVLLSACQPAPTSEPPAPPSIPLSGPALVERGEYLVTVGVCHDCHSPKIMTPAGPEADPTRLLSGQPADDRLAPVPAGLFAPDRWGALTNNHLTAWVGPWGVSFARNLTPDEATGLGSWTEEMFINTIRLGRHQGTGRPLLPPMPWPMYAQMTDDDLRAVFAYLRSLPPINNPVPEPLAPEDMPR